MVAMDLPKGIVVNTPGISRDVERINAEPVAAETISHFWKVYTTTQRTLRDPTAQRLENYWWRIWGSRQRELRGATVAQLFLYISDGNTFNGRPLLSKVNRFEGNLTAPRIENGENIGSNTSAEPTRTSNARPSSSSRGLKKAAAPMPPPILKKSRGPSNTGPHPTARFVSPRGSDDESEKQGLISPNEHVVIRPPTPESKGEKKSQTMLKVPLPSSSSAAKKKGKSHVVPTAAGRRRPAVVRRKSSQSPSERHTSEKSTSNTSEEQGSGDEMEKESPIRDSLPTAANTGDVENFSKKGSSGGLTRQPKLHGSEPTDISTKDPQSLGVAGPGPSSQFNASQNDRQAALHESGLEDDDLKELELQKLLLAEGNAKVKARHPTKGGSHVVRKNPRSMSLSNLRLAGNTVVSSDVKGKASVAPRYEEAAGELGHTSASIETKKIEKGKDREVDDLQFPKRTVPSLIAKESSINKLANPPVSKSQSQLALLLQQDRARTNEPNGKSKSKGKGKERQTDTGSEDTPDEGLEIPPRGKKKKR